MIILIAESKTMTACDEEISVSQYAAHAPFADGVAGEIMKDICDMDIDDLISASRLSQPMARRLRAMAYEFPDKSRGSRAIEAFTGVVFKSLGYAALSPQARLQVDRDVRIVSSLYGWLRPDDIIKSYRLDYGMPLTRDGSHLSAFWKDEVTNLLVNEIKKRGEECVLDMLPAEASKCVDWKSVRKICQVWKVNFRTVADGGSLMTPHAANLKKARGGLLQVIAQSGVESMPQLENLENEKFLPIDIDKKTCQITFAV